jgi:hypothetical protein
VREGGGGAIRCDDYTHTHTQREKERERETETESSVHVRDKMNVRKENKTLSQ